MWKVSYLHMRNYRVSRTFNTKQGAQEFIDNNAMVYPLPGVRLEYVPSEKCQHGNYACAICPDYERG